MTNSLFKILEHTPNQEILKFQMRRPINRHGHVRDYLRMESIIGFSAEQYDQMTIMPNTGPMNTVEKVLAYRQRIIDALIVLGFSRAFAKNFPIMTLYLDGDTTPQMITAAIRAEIRDFKFYPKHSKLGTTGADKGVPTLFDLQVGVLETIEKLGGHLLLHGASANSNEILELEKIFIGEQLVEIARRHEGIAICFEHLSTKDGVQFVMDARGNITATITPQHLLYNLNDLFAGGMRVHRWCQPPYNLTPHQEALIQAAISGHPKFYAGDDTAPHAEHGPDGQAKLSACGCAGVFVAPVSVPVYAKIFADHGALDERFELFMSINGAVARGTVPSNKLMTIERRDWQVPLRYTFGEDDHVVPMCAEEILPWAIIA